VRTGLIGGVRATGVIARRELWAYLRAPIAYVVGVLFLVLQGLSFAALVQVLSDRTQPAVYGAVLRSHFGGTMMHWAVLAGVVAVVAMRLVAEERRSGTWESTLTAPVAEGAVVLGKWLGAVGFWAALWAPTLLYVLVLWRFAPHGGTPDPGPIASAYLGVLLFGAAFLAVGLAASAATDNQIIAAVVAFAALLGLLLVGELDELAPDWFTAHPLLRAAQRQLDVRTHMDRFAQGLLDARSLAFLGGTAAAGLSLAAVAVFAGRRRRGEMRRRAAAAGLITLIALLGNALAVQHPGHWDLTARRSHTLDRRTRALLTGIAGDVEVLVVRPAAEVFDPVYEQVDVLIERMMQVQPRLQRRDLDPLRQPDAIAALAAEVAIPPADLTDGGAVVLRRGERRRVVELLDMAAFARDALGAGALTGFRAEAALATALAELGGSQPIDVCYTTGHGELPAGPAADGADWSGLYARLSGAGLRARPLAGPVATVPLDCQVLFAAAPLLPLAAPEQRALADFLARGGGLLLALPGAGVTAGRPAAGLELLLLDRGVEVLPAAVVDPGAELGAERAWMTVDGYADHPVTASFRGRRLTVWRLPRALRLLAARGPGSEATALVQSSSGGWAESDVAAALQGEPPTAGPADLAGPVAVAAAAGGPIGAGRLVVLGSAEPFTAAAAARFGTGGEVLALSALVWLGGRNRVVPIGDKPPEHVRLVMSREQRLWVLLACAGLLPLAFLGLGTALWWRRRRG
jgi:ABC-2 type transport system permease protein